MNLEMTKPALKKISLKSLGVAALLMFTSIASAQDNYVIKMGVKIEGLPAEYAAMGEMDIITTIKGEKLKTERNGMMESSISVYDGKKMISLSEAMGQKTGFTATKEELEAPDKNTKTEKPKIEYTSEKKMIAGYECTKVLMTTTCADKKDNIVILWVTDKVKYSHPEANKAAGRGMMDLSELKGYPLAMEMNQIANGVPIKILMTTTEISTANIDDSVFILNTDGYTMLSYKDMQAKQKAMMSQGR